MHYTTKEIEIIKRQAYDRGRMEGVVITLIIVAISVIGVLTLNHFK